MNIHLVGGYTASGKTTVINNACRLLNDRNITASIIKAARCDPDWLGDQVEKLRNESAPQVIFAELNTNCTGITISQLKLNRQFRSEELGALNVSTVVDADLLLHYLQGNDLPLKSEEKEVWEKLLLEAEILLVNKVDLLSDCRFEAIQVLARDYFPSKQVILSDSWDKDSVNNWLEMISKSGDSTIGSDEVVESAGVVSPVYLDEEIEIKSAGGSALESAYDLLVGLSEDLVLKEIKVEHCRFFLAVNSHTFNFSYQDILDQVHRRSKPVEKSDAVDLVIKACVHTDSSDLRRILFERLSHLRFNSNVIVREKFISLR